MEVRNDTAFLGAVSAYASATLVDWSAGSEKAAGLFRSDGCHLTTEGIDAWAGMIMAEVMD